MWFKNLYLYQFEKEFEQDADTLHEALSKKPFVECSATQRESMGWVPPLGKNAEAYTHAANGCVLVTMATQERLLPVSVVREELQERVEEIQSRESRKVGSKEKKELTERIEDELLPRAFTRTRKLDAWIDLKGGWLVINTSSASKAEQFATQLRKASGGLPVVPMNSISASTLMTGWVKDFSQPSPLEIGSECEMKSTADDNGVAVFREHELGAEDVQEVLGESREVTKLAMVWDKKISFVVDKDLSIKKLKFLGVLAEKMNEEDPQTHEERIDIEFTLMTGEVKQMVDCLAVAFGVATIEA